MDKRWKNLILIVVIIIIAFFLYSNLNLFFENDSQKSLEEIGLENSFDVSTLTFSENEISVEEIDNLIMSLNSLKSEDNRKNIILSKLDLIKKSILFLDNYTLLIDNLEGTDEPCQYLTQINDLKVDANLILGDMVTFNESLVDNYSNSDYVGFSTNEIGLMLTTLEDYEILAGDFCA